jgi:hypothetical protein
MTDDPQKNLENLMTNSYPGRGIIVGLDQTGKYFIQAYWIMGRSANSRNRIFKNDSDGKLWTEAADESKVKDPSLIFYNAMLEYPKHHYVVSNGDQTDTIMDAYKVYSSQPFSEAMIDRKYEPDFPNFTPRISSAFWLSAEYKPLLEIAILKRSECGDPLPAFTGDPYLLPLVGGIKAIRDFYWQILNPDNRVSLAVKFINIKNSRSKILVKNQYRKKRRLIK